MAITFNRYKVIILFFVFFFTCSSAAMNAVNSTVLVTEDDAAGSEEPTFEENEDEINDKFLEDIKTNIPLIDEEEEDRLIKNDDGDNSTVVLGFNNIPKYRGSDVIVIGNHNYCSEEAKNLVAKHMGKRILMQIPTMKTSTTTWHNLLNHQCLLNSSEMHKKFSNFSFPMWTLGKSCHCCAVPYGIKFKSAFLGYEHVGRAELLLDWVKGKDGFPKVSNLSKIPNEIDWFTMLRNPLDRIKSLHNHISTLVKDKYPDLKSWMNAMIQWSSKKYDFKTRDPFMGYHLVDHQAFQMLDFNQMKYVFKLKKRPSVGSIRSIRWQHVWETVNRTLSKNVFMRFRKTVLHDISNLERFPFFGITERFNDSFELFLYQFNVTGKFALQLLEATNTRKTTADKLDNDVKKNLIKYNKMDLILYNVAKEEFEKRLSVMRKCQKSVFPEIIPKR